MSLCMKEWLAAQNKVARKPVMPVLSFPCVQLMDITVKELISDSRLQAAGMKMIADRVPTGMAVSLMDLSVEAECFGATVKFSDDEVPTVVGAVVQDEDDAAALAVPEVGACRTGLYIDAVKEAAALITDRPVMAGVIGPFSLAGRLMDVSEIMVLCYEEPEMVETVLEKCMQFTINYCKAYKEAGANGVVIAEPLAGMLSPSLAEEFSHPYVKQIVDAVQDDGFAVVYHNCGDNVARMKDGIYGIGATAYHFGDAVRLADMFEGAPADVLVMGNVSPAAQLLGGTPDSVKAATLAVLQDCHQYPNFVLSSGCDIPPLSPWENIDAMFAAADDFYATV